MKVTPLERDLTYYIETFGCQMNEHDSEVLAGMLESIGYLPADTPGEADLILLNTCAVRQKPEQKVYALLGKLRPLKERNPALVIAVAGCMPQQEGTPRDLARRFDFIDLILGTHALPHLPRLLEEARERDKPLIDTGEYELSRSGLPVRRASHFKAWLNVIYGCNNYCSYCVVPYVRGRERSRTKEDIMKEATGLARAGYREITLLGQNVNSYGQDLYGPRGYAFADLLLDLNQVEALSRIRFLTSHPKDLSTRLIQAVGEGERACEHFHLPVQSGSNRLLKEMNRRYSRERYLELVAEIKETIPGVALTTDLIVGYPGEREEDFLQTLDLVERARFDSAFAFLYSPRAGTRAALKKDSLPQEEKKKRLQEIFKLQNRISLEINRALVGQTLELLVEGTSRRDPRMQSGRSRSNKLVHFPADQELAGRLVEVPVAEAYTWHLVGESPRGGS